MPKRTPYQCTPVKVWNLVAELFPARFMAPELSLEAVIKKAAKIAGYENFGSLTCLDALKKLLKSIEETGNLHSFGKFYALEVIAGLLANRLKLMELWHRKPEIMEETIHKPLIILGLPRSGTSFLHNLLAQDPTHRFLSNWEATVSQAPPEGTYGYKDDPRRIRGKHLMRLQNYLAPQMKDIHEFHLDGPEECTPLLMQGFTTQALAMIFNVPLYSEWLKSASHIDTYRHHKCILQTLQWKYPGERWLLKSPDHIQAVETMLEIFPDACFIYMHRDPVKCVSSWASLNATFRGIHSKSIDFNELGLQALDRLATDFARCQIQRRRCNPSRFIDVEYSDLVHDPMETIRRIYQWFEIGLPVKVEERIQVFIANDREHKSTHQYSPEYFGLTTELIQRRFQVHIDTSSTLARD